MSKLLSQAVIFSVEKPAYHGMEIPPYGGLDFEDIQGMMPETETHFGVIWGMEGTECRFPKGYDNFKILEVSNFMPITDIPKWISDTSKELGLPQPPKKLPDLKYADKVA